jgi:hypothetical protein
MTEEAACWAVALKTLNFTAGPSRFETDCDWCMCASLRPPRLVVEAQIGPRAPWKGLCARLSWTCVDTLSKRGSKRGGGASRVRIGALRCAAQWLRTQESARTPSRFARTTCVKAVRAPSRRWARLPRRNPAPVRALVRLARTVPSTSHQRRGETGSLQRPPLRRARSRASGC